VHNQPVQVNLGEQSTRIR